METAIAVANTFIGFSLADRIPVTNMKVQKLVFFAHGWYLGNTGEPLIEETFEAWPWGPVIYPLYCTFKDYRAEPITKPADDFEVKTTETGGLIFIRNTPMLKHPDRVLPFLKQIWERYKNYSASQLSAISHEDGSPWSETRKDRLPSDIHVKISNYLIKDYYQNKVADIRAKQNLTSANG